MSSIKKPDSSEPPPLIGSKPVEESVPAWKKRRDAALGRQVTKPPKSAEKVVKQAAEIITKIRPSESQSKQEKLRGQKELGVHKSATARRTRKKALEKIVPVPEEREMNALTIHEVIEKLNSKALSEKIEHLRTIDKNIISMQREATILPQATNASARVLLEYQNERIKNISSLYNTLIDMLKDCAFVTLRRTQQSHIFETIHKTLKDDYLASFIAIVLRHEISQNQFRAISNSQTIGSTLCAQFVSSKIDYLLAKDEGEIRKKIQDAESTEEKIEILIKGVQKLPVLKTVLTEYMNAIETNAKEKRLPFPEREAIKGLSSFFERSIRSLLDIRFGSDLLMAVSFSPNREVFELSLEPRVYELAAALVNRNIVSKSPIAVFINRIRERNPKGSVEEYMKALKNLIEQTIMKNPKLTEFDKLPYKEILTNDFDIVEQLVGPKAAKLLKERFITAK